MHSVSVVIAAYNAAPFLHRAVSSALHQTLPPLEVLIIDDLSTDDTVAVANRLSHEDGRIRVIRLMVNGGPSVARNAGLASAKGDWVAILDADDVFDPNHLAVLSEVAASGDFNIVLGNFVYCDPKAAVGDHEQTAGLARSGPVNVIDAAYYVSHCAGESEEADWGLLKPYFSLAFLRLKSIAYPTKSRHGEDFLFIVETLMNGAKVCISRRPTYRYTLRSSNWSKTRIDYQSMIEHTRLIGLDKRAFGNPAMKPAIEKRILGIQNVIAARKISARRAAGENLPLLAEMMTDRFVRQQLMKKMWKKAVGLVGRSIER